MSDNPMKQAMRGSQAGMDAAKTSVEAGTNAVQSMGKTMNDMGASVMSEFSRLFTDMKPPVMPGIDALMAAHRRNLETLAAANRVALDGAQAVARRNMEIMQHTMAELTDGIRQMSGGDTPQARSARQAEMLKSAYERAVANMQEIGDLIQKSNGEAMGLLNRRFAEAMDEVKTLGGKAG